MSELYKVVWAEGVFLGQQHFQEWDRQLDSRLKFELQSHSPFYWGVISAEWNAKALDDGRFELQKLQCIMPNGMPIDFDRDLNLNDSLTFDLNKIDGHEVVLSVVVPQNDSVEDVAGYQSQGRACGWKARFKVLADDLDASRKRDVMVAQPNLQLRADGGGAEDQMQCLRLVKIQRHSGSEFKFKVADDVLPACLSIGAVSMLQDQVHSTVDMLANSVREFSKNRMKIGDISSYSTTEMADFLYQKELVVLLQEFRQLMHHKAIHPYVYYRSLVRLHQIIATHLKPESIDKIQAYNHNELGASLNVLVSEIREMAALKKDRPESQIQLVTLSTGRFESTSIPRHALESFSFYLAVDAKQDSVDWVSRFVDMNKLGSPEQLDTMMASGIPGVPLRHVQRLPQKIRIKSGYEYFQIQTDHKLWSNVLQSQKFGLFCMGEFSDASVELIVLEEK